MSGKLFQNGYLSDAFLHHFVSTSSLLKLMVKVCRDGSNGGAIEVTAPLKPTKVTLFTMMLYNSEKTFAI